MAPFRARDYAVTWQNGNVLPFQPGGAMTIEQRMQRVEKELRRWRVFGVVSAVAVIALAAVGGQQRPEAAQDIRVRSLAVVDANDKPVFVVTAPAAGGAQLVMELGGPMGAGGQLTAGAAEGAPYLTLRGANNRAVFRATSFKDIGFVGVYGADGEPVFTAP
jgi:hypothetical protein